MAKMTFDAKAVQALLQKRKIATLEESATARRAGGMMKAPRGGLERMKRAKALPE